MQHGAFPITITENFAASFISGAWSWLQVVGEEREAGEGMKARQSHSSLLCSMRLCVLFLLLDGAPPAPVSPFHKTCMYSFVHE
ncbi:hypothetical protein E2C01_051371 [Portunus trituberculatus]|uniref:Uncharacterized protein n=1 Tax=Portunus trituberculatus TaxID=210409 RepID=A0A5B7GEJ8_PORTR|nr:hypothetical protein [Portunus trituberculatus]